MISARQAKVMTNAAAIPMFEEFRKHMDEKINIIANEGNTVAYGFTPSKAVAERYKNEALTMGYRCSFSEYASAVGIEFRVCVEW